MNTNRFARFVFALIAIAILSSMLSACNAVEFVADAAYNKEATANWQTLAGNPQLDNCDASSKIQISGAMNAATDQKTGVVDGTTIGAWLDEKDAKGLIGE